MNAAAAQLTIMRPRYRRAFVLPNYTPMNWFECDVFEVTAAGFFREYEVKLTVSDFRADAKKEHNDYNYAKMRREGGKKHDLLAGRSVSGPRQFFYVTPAGLLQSEALPEWAGLIELDDRGPMHAAPWRYQERLVKKAPALHREKVREELLKAARGVIYYRLHTLLIYGARGNVDVSELSTDSS